MALLPDILRAAGAPGAAAALRADPLLNHNFVVSLLDTSSALAAVGSAVMSAVTDVALGGFSECSGLEMSMKVEDYNEGGNNGTVLKFPGRVSYGNLTFKKGQGTSSALWDWHYGFVIGRGKRREIAIPHGHATSFCGQPPGNPHADAPLATRYDRRLSAELVPHPAPSLPTRRDL